jgi:uncharacterized membrane protein
MRSGATRRKREMVKDRYARGEIDRNEYEQKIQDLENRS